MGYHGVPYFQTSKFSLLDFPGLRGSQSDLSEEEGKQESSKKSSDKDARKRKTSRIWAA